MNNQGIDDVAAGWVIRRSGQPWTPVEEQQLTAWLEESSLHRVAFLRLQRVWQQVPQLKALGTGSIPSPETGSFEGLLEESRSLGEAHSGWLRRHGYWAAAALVVAAVVAAWWFQTRTPAEVRYATRIGGLETLTLQDGSRVTLNTNTAIRVRFDQGQRRIDLDSGEAFFEVAPDPGRPFSVAAANTRTTALGTAFSVHLTGLDVSVIVSGGKVQVGTEGTRSSAAPTLLGTGDQASVRGTEVTVRRISDSELDALLSWRAGFLVFRDTPLEQAVAEFNRYRTQKIRIEDASIAATRISGKFKADNAQAFLWLLEQGFPISVEEQPGYIGLKHRG